MEWYPEHFLWNCTPVNAKEPHRLSGQHWFRQCLSAIRHQAITWVTEPSHFLSWCWPKSMSPYGVKKYHLLKGINFVEALYWLHNGLSSTTLIISFAIPSCYFRHKKITENHIMSTGSTAYFILVCFYSYKTGQMTCDILSFFLNKYKARTKWILQSKHP